MATVNGERDSLSGQSNGPFKQQYYIWGLAGIALASPLFVIAAISPQFDYQIKNLEKPILLLVVLMMAAGAPYLWVIYRFKSFALDRRLMIWIIGLGLLARLRMFASTPILEDDFYRYFWDGGVLANGFNPYNYSPH